MSPTASTRKPRTASPAVRRRQPIDATISCIGRHGISSTTLTAVTKEAGLSQGLMNLHFKSKNARLAETLKTLAAEHRAQWIRALKRGDLGAADKLAMVDAQSRVEGLARKALQGVAFGSRAERLCPTTDTHEKTGFSAKRSSLKCHANSFPFPNPQLVLP